MYLRKWPPVQPSAEPCSASWLDRSFEPTAHSRPELSCRIRNKDTCEFAQPLDIGINRVPMSLGENDGITRQGSVSSAPKLKYQALPLPILPPPIAVRQVF